jgi:hypothetical protein
MNRLSLILIALLGVLPGLEASRSGVKQEGDTPVSSSEKLPAGRFEWEPGKSPSGVLAILVSLPRQMLYVYRGGVLIARSSVSSGRPGHSTPSGLFPILGKEVMHYSNLYQHAPMPYMQRLTMEGVALHAGYLPGEPASHGCIRLPGEFARRLFGITACGDPVLVVGRACDVVKGSGSDMPSELDDAARGVPPSVEPKPPQSEIVPPPVAERHPVAVASTLPPSGKSMAQLEEEELSIRNNPSLDRQARRDELLRIWSEQRALMGKP